MSAGPGAVAPAVGQVQEHESGATIVAYITSSAAK